MRRLLAQYRRLQTYARKIGVSAACRVGLYGLILRRLNFQAAPELHLKLKNASYALKMRTGKSSDPSVLRQVFMEEEYAAIDLVNPATIIDLGANVGYSSAYFLSRFPSARVVAVEPDPENYLICLQNLKPFGAQATVLHGAVWPEKRLLAVQKGVFGDGREWATQVSVTSSAGSTDSLVQGYDMDSLIALTNCPEVDLLKIDIERCELELFSRDTALWMPRIKNICIELHDEECSAVFFSALSGYAYESSRSGELTICSNLRPLSMNSYPLKVNENR